jgi:Protein of unknown function (DUF4232)
MRAAVRLGWRVAAVVAFGATAALAVTLTRGAPLHAALTSAGSARSHDASHAPRCTTSGLRISVGGGASGAGTAGLTVTWYPLDFTNVSGVACTLGGYPGVATYTGDDVRVGNAAAADSMTPRYRVVLAPGATARAAVIASVPVAAAGGCKPVVATGLRVVPPGESVARYIRHPLLACSAAGPRAPVFLSVTAVQPGPSTLAVTAAPPARPRAARGKHRVRATPPLHTALAAGLAV